VIIVWFIFMSWISGYRDCARFWYKKDWSIESKAKYIPYWEAKNNLDPFHSAGGLMWALIIIFLVMNAIWDIVFGIWLINPILYSFGSEWYLILATLAVHGIIAWQFFYWQRNIFMHIIAMSKGYRRMKYLNPFSFLNRKK